LTTGDAGAIVFVDRATGHPIARAGGTIAAAGVLAACHRDQAIVQLALCTTRDLAPGRRRYGSHPFPTPFFLSLFPPPSLMGVV
jgi:hypothetical protein